MEEMQKKYHSVLDDLSREKKKVVEIGENLEKKLDEKFQTQNMKKNKNKIQEEVKKEEAAFDEKYEENCEKTELEGKLKKAKEKNV